VVGKESGSGGLYVSSKLYGKLGDKRSRLMRNMNDLKRWKGRPARKRKLRLSTSRYPETNKSGTNGDLRRLKRKSIGKADRPERNLFIVA